jgi:hypothetical protein
MSTSRHPTFRWTHPGRENPPQHPCPLCERFIGMVFSEADRAILPALPHCDCAWESTQNELGLYDPVTWWHWSEMPDEVRWNFILKVAWLLRQDPPEPVPPSLQPLIPEAEAYNRMREEDDARIPNSAVSEAARTPHSAISAASLRPHSPLQFRGRLIAAGDIRNVLDKPAGMVWTIPALVDR